MPTSTSQPLPEPVEVTLPLTPPQAVETTAALVWVGADPTAPAVVLAHGAGTDMRHRHMRRHAADLVAGRFAVALFNFGYTEAGRKSPDPAPRLMSAWRDVITGLRPHLGAERALVVGGRSMGGRLASMVAAEDAAGLGIAGVACIAYPLHPPGKPDRLRVDHWPSLRVPTLLVCGSRDAMAPTETLRACVADHMPAGIATLHVLQGADHSFRVRRSDGRTEDEVFTETAEVIAGWLDGL